MIHPTNDDIGRSVVFKDPRGYAPTDEGVITSYNDKYVFVRYGRDYGSKATRRDDLEWSVASRRTFP